MKQSELSENAKNATIDRKDFDAALSRLLAASPMPKKAVSRKIAQTRTRRVIPSAKAQRPQ